MMKHLYVFILMLVVGLSGVSAQSGVAMVEKHISVKSVLIDDNRKEYTIYGGGFVVSGKYLATTYSTYRPVGFKQKPKRMVVYYHPDGGAQRADSVEVDLAYSYTDGQYDFSKHEYKPDRLDSDFIVLKLRNEIYAKSPLPHGDAQLTKYSRLHVVTHDTNQQKMRSDTLTYLFRQFFRNETDKYQLVMFGVSKAGYAGSPIYNEHGEMVALLQFSMGQINEKYLSELMKVGWLTESDVSGIRQGYMATEPAHLILGTNVGYLWDTYLKGF